MATSSQLLVLSDPDTRERAAGYLIQLAMSVLRGEVYELDIEARNEFLEVSALGYDQQVPGRISYTVRSV